MWEVLGYFSTILEDQKHFFCRLDVLLSQLGKNNTDADTYYYL